MNSAITIQQLSKKYTRTGNGNAYATLRESIANTFKKKGDKKIDFWALEDINLSINKGDRLGIIGRNGAGKSTLLKIISRITPPTSGQIVLNGRVASLLEVGTGFHPELSGMENIYLNGSILGLKRFEITQRLDEIINFSGVGSFINTPLKNYSTGMALRLAFSVAAHLEPEILLIDEVLAVGDLEFQKKCLGKMDEISRQHGRTILFVSHNLEAISKLCNKAAWLDSGKIKLTGRINEVVSGYVNETYHETEAAYSGANDLSKEVCITQGSIITNHVLPNVLKNQDFLVIKMEIVVNTKKQFSFEFLIRDSMKVPLLFLPIGLVHGKEHTLERGIYTIKITAGLPVLTKDRYFIDLIIAETNKSYIHYLEAALYFDVESKIFDQTNFKYEAEHGMGKVLLTDDITIEIK